MHASAVLGDSVASGEVGGGGAVLGPDGSEVEGITIGYGVSGPEVVATGAGDVVDALFTSVGVGVSTGGDVDGVGVRGARVAPSVVPDSVGFSHTYCLFTWGQKEQQRARPRWGGGGEV